MGLATGLKTYTFAERPYTETVSGRHFYLDNPKWEITDMAWNLSMQCRYAGACRRFYSVAEHSLLVMRLMRFLQLGNGLEGLLHDGHESIASDISSPWKPILPDYQAFEHALERSMRVQFGLTPDITEGCKLADRLALLIEARDLMNSGGEGWYAGTPEREQADTIYAERPEFHVGRREPKRRNVYADFLYWFQTLTTPDIR